MPLTSVSAISLDLDDTLWAFGPTVAGAEEALRQWLMEHAPRTEPLLAAPGAVCALRAEYEEAHPELAGNYRGLRLGSIADILQRSQEDVAMVQPAYEAFFAARQKVVFFDDALPALAWLSARFPLVAVSNGNANLALTGGGEYFVGSLAAAEFGVAKPDAAIFHAAADMAAVKPAAMLHVGDDFDADVVGAQNAGFQAAWLLRAGSTHAERSGSHLTIPCLLSLCEALGAEPGIKPR